MTTFPSLRTLDAVRHNLPVQQTGLIGREAETAAVIEALTQSRLVTLTGVGGCGKTRLALAVAADLAQTAHDGVFFVALSPVTDGGDVVSAVTESMGARLARLTPSDLARFVESRQVLLVLDNCEHLLDEVADLVDEVLSTGAGPRVLVTSREALGAAGEWIVRVPSLPIDGGDERSSPAVTLLVERMRRAAGRDVRIDESSGVLVEICRRLDGIPLAIELAAAQMTHMSPAELLERIDRRFELLVGGHGRRRQRQQTLQAIMDWSWDLLAIDERCLLAACSIFSGDWSIDGAEAVGDPFVSGAVARVLPALVRKSLVEPVFTVGATRYRLLETVRLFAAGKLVDLGLAEQARTVHAEFHLDRARVTSVDEAFLDLDVIDLVHRDLTDLGAAIDWLTTRAKSSDAAELVVLAGGCYSRAFSSQRGVTEVEQLARLVDDPVLRARMLISGAFAAVCTGEHVRTQEWVTEARRLAEGRDAFAFCDAAVLAAVPLILVDPGRASRFLVEADGVALRSGSPLCQGGVQLWLNIADLCAPELGLRVADEHDASAFGGPRSLGWAIARQVGALRAAEQGRRDQALELLLPMPVTSAGVDDDHLYALAVEALAGDPHRVAAQAAESMRDVDSRGDVVWHAEMLVTLGIARLRADDPADAIVLLEVARHAPMFFPFWYALARRFGRHAGAALDPTTVTALVGRARELHGRTGPRPGTPTSQLRN